MRQHALDSMVIDSWRGARRLRPGSTSLGRRCRLLSACLALLLSLPGCLGAAPPTPPKTVTVTYPWTVRFYVGVGPTVTDTGTLSFTNASLTSTQRLRFSVRMNPSVSMPPPSTMSFTTANAVNGTGYSGTLSMSYVVVYEGQAGKTSGSVDMTFVQQRYWPLLPVRSPATGDLIWKVEYF